MIHSNRLMDCIPSPVTLKRRDDKRGAIPESTPQILKQLNIGPKHWCYLSQNFESQFKSLVGMSYHIKQACEQLGKQWVHGIRACEKFFPA
jgi:hypothetical protein